MNISDFPNLKNGTISILTALDGRPLKLIHIEIIQFIATYQSENGYSPSVREIASKFKLSNSGVHYRIQKLIRFGYMKRGKVARNIVITPRGETLL